MTRPQSRFSRSGASLLLGALLLAPAMQQKGCDQKGAATPSATPAGEFNSAAAERDVRRQIEDLRVAFESKQTRGVMRAIDPTGISAYSSFEDQISSLMDSTSELRLSFRSANLQVRAGSGTDKPATAQAAVDAEMVYSLKSSPAQQKRKTGKLQMDLVLGEAGWRFTKLEPRSFFTP
jgi:hypothetical protein